MIVAGLGPSVRELATCAYRPTVVGVNDVEAYVGPVEHLVLLDSPEDFIRTNGKAKATRRLRTIQRTQAGTVWVFDRHLDKWPHLVANHPDVRPISIRVPRRDEATLRLVPGQEELLHYQISPYTAASLAFRLGAERIGLLGVDLIPGDHPVSEARNEINVRLGRLRAAMAQHGVDLVNLSPVSSLNSLPKEDLAEWTERPKS